MTEELPEGAEIVLTVFETRQYPWKRNAKRFFWKNFPNIWKSIFGNPYLQSSSFGKKQDDFERRLFFPDGNAEIQESWNVQTVENVNSAETTALFEKFLPDVLFVYGTGKIYPEIFDWPEWGAINAHGGKLPDYRGLDTNLWTALDGHPGDMMVTIHKIDEDLDTGAVYLEEKIPPHPEMALHSLRYFTTVVCTDMYLEVAQKLLAGKLKPLERKGENGRYCHPMPWLTKLKTDRILRQWGCGSQKN